MDGGSGPQNLCWFGADEGLLLGWMDGAGNDESRHFIFLLRCRCSELGPLQHSPLFRRRRGCIMHAARPLTPSPAAPPFPQCAWRGLASNDHGVSREWHSGRQSGACAGTGAAEAPKERRGVGYDGRSRFHECRRHVSANYSRSRRDFRLSSILQTRVGRRPPPGQLGASGAATCTSLSLCSTLPGLKLKAGCAVASLHAYESLGASFLKGIGALCVYPTA